MPPKYPSNTPPSNERIATLEAQTDRLIDDVKALANQVERKFEGVEGELQELSESQALQTQDLNGLKIQVSNVQSSISGMKQEILHSVTGLITIARNTEKLDATLKEDSALFSKEKIASYRNIGAAIAMIASLIYGFIQYIGAGFSKGNDQAYIDHLQNKDKKKD